MAEARADPLENFFPLASMLGFAAAWWLGGIYVATAVLMGLMTLQVVLLAVLRRAVKKPVLAMWGLVVGLGALTLLLRDKAFIQMKTSIVYGGFAAVLLIAEGMRKSLPAMALGKFFAPPAAVWRRVTFAAAGYFLALSGCNYFVATRFSEAVWVGVKTFGFPAVTMVMTFVLVFFLYRYAKIDGGGGGEGGS